MVCFYLLSVGKENQPRSIDAAQHLTDNQIPSMCVVRSGIFAYIASSRVTSSTITGRVLWVGLELLPNANHSCLLLLSVWLGYMYIVGYYCALPVIVFTEKRQPDSAQSVCAATTGVVVSFGRLCSIQYQSAERARQNGPDACGYIGSASTCW